MMEAIAQAQESTQTGEDKPLLELPIPLSYVVEGEDDTFRTQNGHNFDFERHNVIQRMGGNIHSQVSLLEVKHGTYDENGDEATLLVFGFRFEPLKNTKRVTQAVINMEFFASSENGTRPVVESIAPDGRWTVCQTIDNESTTTGAELNVGAPAVLNAGAKASLARTLTRDVTGLTTITGFRRLGAKVNTGDYRAAGWNLMENKRHETGVPDSAKVAVLLRRVNGEPFNAKVTLEASYDFVTDLQQKYIKLMGERPLDDPVLFNPRSTEVKPGKGREYDVQNLSKSDIFSLCEVRMGVAAPFAVSKQN